jgi:nudix-type nucleoside diphosphatase (YffH/AdpP family)
LDQDNPVEAIKRETEEETGYRIQHVQKVFEAYMSPGSVSEILYFFIAAYTPQMKVHKGGGVEAEQEDIEVIEIPYIQAMAMMGSGEIKDAKTIMLLQYLKINQIF